VDDNGCIAFQDLTADSCHFYDRSAHAEQPAYPGGGAEPRMTVSRMADLAAAFSALLFTITFFLAITTELPFSVVWTFGADHITTLAKPKFGSAILEFLRSCKR
jgi:hypothetical protein